MESYPMFHRPEQPPIEQSAAARAHSRFVEGSMNDRVSNEPPPTFLGPEELAAYERQFYADTAHMRSRPISGSEHSFNKTSGNKFWEGLREKLHISRTKSSSSIITVGSNKSKSSNRLSHQSQATVGGPNDKENAFGYYPSREEVMENYKNLIDTGFFSSHAIQGTRHQPAPSWTSIQNDHPLPAPPPPPGNKPPVPFPQVAGQKEWQPQHQSRSQHNPATPALSSIFVSIPYSATQPSPTGDAPLTTYARPDPRPPISLPKKYRRPQTAVAPMAPPVSPYRGTKRGMADMTGGSTDRETAAAGSSGNGNGIGDGAEAGARKLVKKLRKSASRISADLSLRPATSAGNGGGGSSPYGLAVPGGGGAQDVRGGSASSTSVNLVPRPPISTAGRAMGVVRSLSNSFKRDGGSKMAIAGGGGQGAPAGGNDEATMTAPVTTTTTPTPGKLTKAKRPVSQRGSLGRSRSRSMSSSAPISYRPAQLPPPLPAHRPVQSPPLIIPFTDPEPATAAPRTSTSLTRQQSALSQESGGGDPMVIDSDAEPPTRNTSLDMQPGGLSVPSFHYPQRQKKKKNVLPLGAVRDPNPNPSPHRGVPGAPGLMHFAGAGKGGACDPRRGSFCFGTPGGMGEFGAQAGPGAEVEKENLGAY